MKFKYDYTEHPPAGVKFGVGDNLSPSLQTGAPTDIVRPFASTSHHSTLEYHVADVLEPSQSTAAIFPTTLSAQQRRAIVQLCRDGRLFVGGIGGRHMERAGVVLATRMLSDPDSAEGQLFVVSLPAKSVHSQVRARQESSTAKPWLFDEDSVSKRGVGHSRSKSLQVNRFRLKDAAYITLQILDGQRGLPQAQTLVATMPGRVKVIEMYNEQRRAFERRCADILGV